MNCLPKKSGSISQSENSDENKEKFVTASQDNGSQYINIKINELLTGKKEANPQILSGDIVTVLEAQPIYVIGGVANPKQISTNFEITLSRAIDSAGGITKHGSETKISIFRRNGTQTQIIEADLGKIKSNLQGRYSSQSF